MNFEKARKPIRLMYTWEILHAGIDAVIEEDIDRINEIFNCPNFRVYIMSVVYSSMIGLCSSLKKMRCGEEVMKYEKYHIVFK